MASTGLRTSEALRLSDHDVDLEAGVLTIRQTKFRKSRLVPVQPSAVASLAAYRALHSQLVGATVLASFFVGSRGQSRGLPLGKRRVAHTFTQLRGQLGWVDRGGYGQPRVHDLRHSFAVRRLTLWDEKGADLDQRMLALSTSMGHVKISYTYWYLTSTPELMALAGARFERFADAQCVQEPQDA